MLSSLSISSGPRIRKPAGIDLGSATSAIALLGPTDSHFIAARDDQCRCTFPSVVGYHAGQKRLVAGRLAQSLLVASATSEAPGTSPLASLRDFRGSEQPVAIGLESMSAGEGAACLLRHLQEHLAGTLASPQHLLDVAVLTAPTWFDARQTEVTRQAAALAGIEVLEVLPEPIAAATYHSWSQDHEDATYLVYDLGGSFDVAIVRRRGEEWEVLAAGGDRTLGGELFDRLLASHLLQAGRWTASAGEREWGEGEVLHHGLGGLFDQATAAGATRFGRLMQVAEGIKTALSEREQVERFVPGLVRDAEGRLLTLEATVKRTEFEGLIRSRLDPTIELCHETLAQVRDPVDHVILAGGSSRVPLVRELVRAAVCIPAAGHVRRAEPLLDEPELCVAYGAALQGAQHGVRYRFVGQGTRLDLHLTSPARASDPRHKVTGVLQLADADRGGTGLSEGAASDWEGCSVRIRSHASGLSEEVFLAEGNGFSSDSELDPESDNVLELVVCDEDGREVARTQTTVRHQAKRSTGQGEPSSQGSRPTLEEVTELGGTLDELITHLPGGLRYEARARASRIRDDLLEALRGDDESLARQRLSELRELVLQIEAGRPAALDPPWAHFAKLVRQCLDLAAEMATRTGRDRQELFEYVHAQERYAEHAYQELDQALYRECCENLGKYAGYLAQLLQDAMPRGRNPGEGASSDRPPEEEARDAVERFRALLSAVWKRVRSRGRKDLEARLTAIASKARGLSQQIRTDPVAGLRLTNRLGVEVEKIGQALDQGGARGGETSLLEGSG
jgi:hypothetical protein